MKLLLLSLIVVLGSIAPVHAVEYKCVVDTVQVNEQGNSISLKDCVAPKGLFPVVASEKEYIDLALILTAVSFNLKVIVDLQLSKIEALTLVAD